jgi:hypothetical protein
MKTIIIKHNDGKEFEKNLFDIEKENCPICDTPLSQSSTSWNMFHGEVNRDCCNSPYQTKDFSPPDGEEDNYKEYFDEVNKPNMQSIKIKKDLWKPLKEAFIKFDVQDCRNDNVYNEIKHLIN